MRARLFSAQLKPSKFKEELNTKNEAENKKITDYPLEMVVEWHGTALSDLVKKKVSATHIESFLDLYQPYTEADLGKSGITKKMWLSKMIRDELKLVEKGELFLATASVQDQLIGFAICKPVAVREVKIESDRYKADVHISLLAVKPLRLKPEAEKSRIGVGLLLVESIESRFTEANVVTLDTRYINTDGIKFYGKVGFKSTGKRTFDTTDTEHYLGFEKPLNRMGFRT